MALTDIEAVRLYIGATSTSPFYALLSNNEIQFFIDNTSSIYEAAKFAANAMYAQIVAIPIREKTGEIEVWNDIVNGYLKFLDKFISSTSAIDLRGLMPYAAGISKEDVLTNTSDPDVVKSKLSQMSFEETYNVCEDNCLIQ